MKDWQEVHQIFLEIGDALMSVGTKRNMSEDWYAMVMKFIEYGISIAYAHLTVIQVDGQSCSDLAIDTKINSGGICNSGSIYSPTT